MFSFFFLSSYTLFLRMNTEQQIRSLHKHLPRTWGGAEGLTPGRSLGQGAVPIEALPAGLGGGGEPRVPGRKGEGESRAVLAVLPDTYPPPPPFTGTDRARGPACALPPLSPTLWIGKLRPRTTAKRREATRPTKVTRQASRSRTPGLVSSGPARHYPCAQRPGLRPQRRTRSGETRRAETRCLGESGPTGAPGAARLHPSRPGPPPPSADPEGKESPAEAAPGGGPNRSNGAAASHRESAQPGTRSRKILTLSGPELRCRLARQARRSPPPFWAPSPPPRPPLRPLPPFSPRLGFV